MLAPFETMNAARKITVILPEKLLKDAQKVTGEGLTPTIRRGLELVSAGQAYDGLRRLRGKVKFPISLKRLREDRS